MLRIATVLLLFAAAPAQAQFRGQITVERILLDVRVTDLRGHPVDDLSASDFDVRIGGRPAAVESAEWIADVPEPRIDGGAVRPGPGEMPVPGRLIVLFAQTDHARQSFRMRGQINFNREAVKVIEGLEPSDRLAVFQFDSHLKLRLDFTSDKEAATAALKETILTSVPPAPAEGDPSLVRYLDPEEMRRTWTVEDALTLIGRALAHIPGPKSMLLIGWGMGVRSGSGWVHMRWQDYADAVKALRIARTAVFSLDVAWADGHDLSVGLARIAADTGGFYTSTFRFPDLAIARLQRTLGGHYELVVRRPDSLARGGHPLEILVRRPRATVYAQSMMVDR